MLEALHSLGESNRVISCVGEFLGEEVPDKPLSPENGSDPSPLPLDRKVLSNLLDLVNQLSREEEKLTTLQVEVTRKLVGIEETKRSLQELLKEAFRSPPIPEELRERALKEHSPEEVEGLVRDLQTAGSFSFDDIMVYLEKGSNDREPAEPRSTE